MWYYSREKLILSFTEISGFLKIECYTSYFLHNTKYMETQKKKGSSQKHISLSLSHKGL